MFSFMDSTDTSGCSVILPNRLYLSGYEVGNDPHRYGVRHVVRLGEPLDFVKHYKTHPDVVYHDIVIADSVRCHLTKELLDAAVRFIHEAQGPVLVHCIQGVSRSPSIVIAYLMATSEMGFRETRLYVKGKRPCIRPNDTFIKDLRNYCCVLRSGTRQ